MGDSFSEIKVWKVRETRRRERMVGRGRGATMKSWSSLGRARKRSPRERLRNCERRLGKAGRGRTVVWR